MIYVDALRHHDRSEQTSPRVRLFRLWCHLFADDVEADGLHEFAERIGIQRAWFQDREGFPHYDLTRSKRHKALVAGAAEVDLREWLRWKRPETGPK